MEKISKNQLKYFSSLLSKKHRKAEGLFIAEGKNLVTEAFVSAFCCAAMIVTDKFLSVNPDFINSFDAYDIPEIYSATEKEFSKLADTKSPQGAAGIFNIERIKPVHRNEKIYVAFENISDPGNLGTIFRNCDWFGVTEMILSKDCAEVFNPKVLRASTGSVFHLNISTPEDFYGTLEQLQSEGYKILNTSLNGENIYRYKMPEKMIAVFSNEANGPSGKIIKMADENITIPKFGNAESLNVASSSAIILSEIFAANQIV